MDARTVILGTLADGRFCSGQTLAEKVGLTRAAVWKHIRSLRCQGLDIYAVRGKGYRLAEPLELLDLATVRRALDKSILKTVRSMEILLQTDSTNRYLLAKLGHEGIGGRVVLAEQQTAGRGRRGNIWLSPLGAGVYLSIGWCYEVMPEALMSLSLMVGLAVVRALRTLGVADISLKWPNDIVCNGAKLGGILIESVGQLSTQINIVVGIGLNMSIGPQVEARISQAVTALDRVAAVPVSRNILAARVISETVDMLPRANDGDFAAFLPEWEQYDCCRGKQGRVLLQGQEVSGKILGVDRTGRLLMSVNDRVQRFSSGELSLRISHGAAD